jgi:O-antigen/teichoic acid export membrane protein
MSLLFFLNLFAQGGLGDATARTPELHTGKLSFLVLVAIGLGIFGGLLAVLLAEPWAALWDAPGAVGPARLIGVTALVGPLSGLLLGVQRRIGAFRMLAISMVSTSVAGMAIGVVAVILAPGALTLLVSPVAASVLLVIVSLIRTRRQWWGRPNPTAARADLGYAWRVLGLTMVSYLTGNVGKLSVSRWVGTDVLGQWNRADVLTAVPINQGTSALTSAVYPEFRHDIGVQSRTRQSWTDYLLLIAWVCFPVAAILAGAAPFATATLFGPGWGLAAVMAPFVAIQYGIVAVDNALASALQSVGRFRLLVPTALASVAVIAVGVVVTAVTGSWVGALGALIAAPILRHLLQVVFSTHSGTLDGRSIAKGYSLSLAGSVVLGGAVALVSAGVLGRVCPLATIAGAMTLIAVAAAGIAFKHQLPPIRILRKYRS